VIFLQISQKWLVLEPPVAHAQQKTAPPTVVRKSMQLWLRFKQCYVQSACKMSRYCD
jgi:hypothetical protein